MSQENVEIVRASLDARNRGDWEALRAVFASDCEFDYSRSKGLSPGVYRGSEAVMRMVDEYSEVFEEFGWEPDEFIDAGDAVVVPGRFHSRGKGSGVETARGAWRSTGSWTGRWCAGACVRTEPRLSRPWGCGSSALVVPPKNPYQHGSKTVASRVSGAAGPP